MGASVGTSIGIRRRIIRSSAPMRHHRLFIWHQIMLVARGTEAMNVSKELKM